MKKRYCLFLLLFSLALRIGNTAASAEQIGTRETLVNGVTLLYSERKALPIVTVVIAIKAGSIDEPSEKAGLANLTADLLDQGTSNRSAQDISNEIEFVGGTLGTSGGTDYMTVTLSVLKKDIDLGFSLLADIIVNPSFPSEEISRRKNIVKNIIKQQNEEPRVIASKAFFKAVFGRHPYGWPLEGTEETLDAIKREDIVAFHRARYVPNNAIMTVVGDLKKSELLSLMNTHFTGWNKKHIAQRTLPVPQSRNSPEVIKIHKNVTQATILIGHLGIKRDNPDYYAVSVMNYILGGGGFASRLMDNLRDNRGLAYDVYSSFLANKYAGSFRAGIQTKNPSANIAITEIIKEMERIRTEPVSDKELNDAKSYLTGSFPLRIDSNKKIARFLTAVEFYGLGLDYIDNYKKYIKAVTKGDLLRVAQTYLDTGNYVLVVVGNLEEVSLDN